MPPPSLPAPLPSPASASPAHTSTPPRTPFRPPPPPPPPPPRVPSSMSSPAHDEDMLRRALAPSFPPARQSTSPASFSACPAREPPSPPPSAAPPPASPGLCFSPPLTAPPLPPHVGAYASRSPATLATPLTATPADSSISLSLDPADAGSALNLALGPPAPDMSDSDDDTKHSDSFADSDSDLSDLDWPLLRLSQETDWEGPGPDDTSTRRSKPTGGGAVGLGISGSWHETGETSKPHDLLLVPAPLPMPSASPRIKPSMWTADARGSGTAASPAGLRRRIAPHAKSAEDPTSATDRPRLPSPARLTRWRSGPRRMLLLLLTVLLLVLGPLLLRGYAPDSAWRLDCASQSTVTAAAADRKPPATVVVAVVSSSTRAGRERRMAIRQTWAARVDPGVVVKFLVPPSVDAEMERAAFNDVSAFSSGSVLQWAHKEAAVPVPHGPDGHTRWQVADYLVKTTDDAFLLPHEIERRLRTLPRTRMVWGVPTRPEGTLDTNTWAVSSDLFTAGSHASAPDAAMDVNGLLASGAATARTEKCGVYDHPLSRTPRAHGFITAADVQTIKDEVRFGIGSTEIAARGGGKRYLSYSSVVDHMRPRRPLQRRAADGLASPDPLARVAALMEGSPPTLGGGGNFSALLPPNATADPTCPPAGCRMPLVGTRGPSPADNGGATLAVHRVAADQWLLTALALIGETWREGSELRMISP